MELMKKGTFDNKKVTESEAARVADGDVDVRMKNHKFTEGIKYMLVHSSREESVSSTL